LGDGGQFMIWCRPTCTCVLLGCWLGWRYCYDEIHNNILGHFYVGSCILVLVKAAKACSSIRYRSLMHSRHKTQQGDVMCEVIL